MVFFGEYSGMVTNGGRITLPKKIRDAIQGSVCVVTKGFDLCLFGYGQSDWEDRSREFMTRSLIDNNDLSIRRMLFSGAVYESLDDQGRFVIPKSLLSFAHIEKEIVVAGIGDHFEVWSKKLWEKYINENRQ